MQAMFHLNNLHKRPSIDFIIVDNAAAHPNE